MSQKIFRSFCIAVTLLLSFVIYFETLSPTVSFIDSGELAVVAQTLSIAHPTGYPLYTLLGKIFTLLPVKDTIFRVNLMSLLCVVLANLLLFLIFGWLAEEFIRSPARKIVYIAMKFLIPLTATLIFVFTPVLWSQATTNEVYALHIFLMTLLLYLTLKWWKNPSQKEKIFYLIIFLYGLSFGNHMSSVILAFPLLVLFLIQYKTRLFVSPRIFAVLFLFILGFSVYLYLPIRSAQNPLLDWGNPESWAAFKKHISAWQYQVWIFSETSGELSHRFADYLKLFYRQFPWYLIPFGLAGLIIMFKKSRPWALFAALYFFLDIFFGINYSITDIEPYFLPSFLIFAIWVGVGLVGFLAFVTKSLEKNNPAGVESVAIIFPLIFLLFPALNLVKNYREQDRSRNYFAYDYCQNILKSVDKNGVILTDVWDFYSPWLYIRYIENSRPDVVFLDKELLRRSWYFDYIKREFPEIYKNSESEINSFLEQLFLFESGKPYDPVVIEDRFQQLYNSFWQNNYNDRPAYVNLYGKEHRLRSDVLTVPEGLVFRIRKELTYYPYKFPDWELRGIRDLRIYKDGRTLYHLPQYSLMLRKRASYLTDFKQEAEAAELFRKAQKLEQGLDFYQK